MTGLCWYAFVIMSDPTKVSTFYCLEFFPC